MKAKWIGALAVAAVFGSSATMAATQLRFSHSYTADDERHAWAEVIAEKIQEKTDGEVTVSVHPNQELAKARAQHQSLQQGRIDLAIYPLPWLSGKVPLAEIGALPGLVSTPQDGLVWRERKIWPMLQEAVSEAGVVFAGGGWAMATIGNTGEPILRPSDMAGHKMRGLGRATEAMMMENGATVTSMPASEIYQALQTGVLSGVLTQYASFDGYNLQEVIDHMLVGRGFIGGLHAILLSERVKNKVGDEHYQAVLDAVAESEVWFAEEMTAFDERVATRFEEQGVQIHRLDDEGLAAWNEDARRTAWQYFIDKVPNGEAALEAVNEPL